MLKYADVDFIGQIDNANKIYMWNAQEVDNPTPFNEKVTELLSGLSTTASSSNPKLYATGEVELYKSTKLYGLVQCTRDVSETDCKTLLDGAISELPDCCDAKRGGRVVGGSCNFRYEIYPFVDS
ncbi:putative Gnk2-like domain-containing protein [Rosa chinensis]|uniref:Putative Gnk2-like domain-containing protein n=1 Tax=Rosa chinensis TaxID=74649 RepID=A0A2P6S2I3_ROSCH|nr:putative Gnk2-like domain-containing protein [Rosa chinensis]